MKWNYFCWGIAFWLLVSLAFGQLPRPLPVGPPVAQTTLDWTAVSGTNWSARIQVQIKADTDEGQFNDSLYYSPSEWAALASTDDIDAAVQARIDNWVGIVQAARSIVPVPLTTDQLIQQQTEMQARMDDLLQKIMDSGATQDQIDAIKTAMSAKVTDIKIKK